MHRSRFRRQFLYCKSGSGTVEIRDCLFDFAAAIGVGNQVCPASAMQEDASLQNVRIWIFYCRDFFPLGGLLKIRPDSKRGTPIEIFRRIVAVSEPRWDRDNALVCIARKRSGGWAAAPRASKNINP